MSPVKGKEEEPRLHHGYLGVLLWQEWAQNVAIVRAGQGDGQPGKAC